MCTLPVAASHWICPIECKLFGLGYIDHLQRQHIRMRKPTHDTLFIPCMEESWQKVFSHTAHTHDACACSEAWCIGENTNRYRLFLCKPK